MALAVTIISLGDAPAAGFLSPEGRGQAPFGCMFLGWEDTLHTIAQYTKGSKHLGTVPDSKLEDSSEEH